MLNRNVRTMVYKTKQLSTGPPNQWSPDSSTMGGAVPAGFSVPLMAESETLGAEGVETALWVCSGLILLASVVETGDEDWGGSLGGVRAPSLVVSLDSVLPS